MSLIRIPGLTLRSVKYSECARKQIRISSLQSKTIGLIDRIMRVRLVIQMLAGLATLSAGAGGFEFVVIGDTRPRFESENFRPFEGLIAKINTLKPALVVNLGDLIYGYGLPGKEKQWDRYQAVAKAIEVPYYQIPGNHDTHSKDARKTYGRRFGKFYQSFDYEDCHFVLLDNTEEQHWGYLGPAQLKWLEADLKANEKRSVFVFLHFPVWEPERITPEYYQFWAQTLHPLFKQSRVRAVFAGHYHTYGPTREFDGVRYFITGGGGAELRPDYRKSGGEHHFVKVSVSGDAFDVRVLTGHGEMTDPEADLMGGLQFAAKHVSRMGIKRSSEDLRAGVKFSVSLNNPYEEPLTGRAEWILDASAFLVQPQSVSLQIPAGRTQPISFTLQALKGIAALPSLPRLEFDVVSGGRHHRFLREVRFLQEVSAPYRLKAPTLDGQLADWDGVPSLALNEDSKPADELRTSYDAQHLYLAITVPSIDAEEEKELGFSDELQIGLARALNGTDFSRDLLRLGFSRSTSEARDRTPGHKTETVVPGVRSVCRAKDQRTSYEIALPLRLLKSLKAGPGSRLILDLAFPVPDNAAQTKEPSEPGANTFSYRVRYGSDSLVPVHFVELNLERAK
jgi:calcineurin-like phosphoesterase family protein